MIWLDTKTQTQASERQARMWGTVWAETEGGGLAGRASGEGLYEGEHFWADAIKETHDDPVARLAMAKRHMPLPAAFREAAIALRAIIRAKKKANEDFEQELRELHRWASIQSIAGYDQLEVTPFAKINVLNLEPATIGWDQLTVLNQTDRKLMAARWPMPGRHTTGAVLYPKIGNDARALIERKRKADMARTMSQLDALLASDKAAPPQIRLPVHGAPRRTRGFLARLFGR